MASNRNELWKALTNFKTGNIDKPLKGDKFVFNIVATPDGMRGDVTVSLMLAEVETDNGISYQAAPQPPAPVAPPVPVIPPKV